MTQDSISSSNRALCVDWRLKLIPELKTSVGVLDRHTAPQSRRGGMERAKNDKPLLLLLLLSSAAGALMKSQHFASSPQHSHLTTVMAFSRNLVKHSFFNVKIFYFFFKKTEIF